MGAKDSPDAVYDARPLGVPKMGVFGLQHICLLYTSRDGAAPSWPKSLKSPMRMQKNY